MQDRFKLGSKGKFCMRSMRPFVDGETFISLLVEGERFAELVSPELIALEKQQAAAAAAKEAAKAAAEGKPARAARDKDDLPATLLRRVDLSEPTLTGDDRHQAVVFWKTVFVASKSKKKRQNYPIDTQGLIDLFFKLEDDIKEAAGDLEDPTQRDRIQLRYVVTLMLLRKRKLRLLQFRTDREKKEWMIVMQAAGTRRLKVRVLPITHKDRARLKVELAETLGLGDEVLGEAPPKAANVPPPPAAAVAAKPAVDADADAEAKLDDDVDSDATTAATAPDGGG